MCILISHACIINDENNYYKSIIKQSRTESMHFNRLNRIIGFNVHCFSELYKSNGNVSFSKTAG